MEKTIKQQKKEFMDAYRWALKVQKACMFTQISTSVHCDYTRSNHEDGSIDAWSVSIWIHDNGKCIHVGWHPWYDRDEEFYTGKEYLEDYLLRKGITIK